MSTSPHPVELSNRIIDSGVAEPPHNRVINELTEIDDDVAVVESFSHCWVIRTDEGLVCFDASGVHSGPAVVEAMEQALARWLAYRDAVAEACGLTR